MREDVPLGKDLAWDGTFDVISPQQAAAPFVVNKVGFLWPLVVKPEGIVEPSLKLHQSLFNFVTEFRIVRPNWLPKAAADKRRPQVATWAVRSGTGGYIFRYSFPTQ